MLGIWGMWRTPSLPATPGPLWTGVVIPDRALSKGQIKLTELLEKEQFWYWNCVLMINWIVWIISVCLNWITWKRKVFDNQTENLHWNCVLMMNWIVWIRSVCLNWITWKRNVFDNQTENLHWNCVLMMNWIVWIRIVCLNWITWNRKFFFNNKLNSLKWNCFCMLNWIVWNITDYLYKDIFGTDWPTGVVSIQIHIIICLRNSWTQWTWEQWQWGDTPHS